MADDDASDMGSTQSADEMSSSEDEEESIPTNFAFSSTFNPPRLHELPAYYSPPALPNKVFSVPTELTSMIFDLVDSHWVEFMQNYCTVGDPEHPLNVPLRPGLVLTRVCRLWRKIALGHKKLWTTFVHVTPSRLISPGLLSFYLEQSKPLPLDIVIRAQNFFWPDDDELDEFRESQSDYGGHEDTYLPWTSADVQRVVDALTPHAHRWRRLAFHICIGGFDTAALSPIQNVDAPLLEEFEIIAHNQWRQEPFKYLKDPDDFLIALRDDEFRPDPSRRRTKVARLSFVRFDIVALHLFAPSFADLTVLELRNSHFVRIPRKVFVNIFESAPRLVHVSFMRCIDYVVDFDESLDEEEDEELMMPAPCLEVFRSFNSDMSTFMWKYLQAPQLKDIVIADVNLDKLPFWAKDAWEDSFNPDEIQTPFPTLERLVLDDCNGESLTRDALLQICRMTSSITQLVLIRDDSMLDLMLRIGNNPILWPNLRLLKLAGSPYASSRNSHSGDMAALARLVEWRREAFGQHCVIEKDLRCRHHVRVSDETLVDGEVLRTQFKALLDKGTVRLDPFSYSDHPWPEWPPRAGQERPTNVRELWCVEMLGALDNPWF